VVWFIARRVQKRVGKWRAGNKIPADAGAKLLEFASGAGDTLMLFERCLVIGDLVSMRAIPLDNIRSVEARGALHPQIRVHYIDEKGGECRVTQSFAFLGRAKVEAVAEAIRERASAAQTDAE